MNMNLTKTYIYTKITKCFLEVRRCYKLFNKIHQDYGGKASSTASASKMTQGTNRVLSYNPGI